MDKMGKGKVLHQMDQNYFFWYPKANVGRRWFYQFVYLNPSFRDGVDEHGPDSLLGFGNHHSPARGPWLGSRFESST